MRSNSIGLFSPRAAWTCPQCVRSQQFTARRQISYRPRIDKLQSPRPSRRRNITLLAVGGVTAGASAVWFFDDIKFAYDASARTLRVAKALFVNIRDYRKVLNHEYDDPEQGSVDLKACHKRCAVRTLRVLEKNGSIFIKLGQHLSSMGYLLPDEWVATFVPLQDKCPVSSYESIEEMFVQDTGHKIEEDFDDFSKWPIGAASLAQVHTAILKETGQKVAVKVQHPALARYCPLDLALTRFTFTTVKRFFPEYDLEWLSREMEFSLPQELDFSLEGRNAMRASKYFKENTSLPLIIPEVIAARPRILVMQYLSGRRPDDLAFLDANHISRSEVSATLARIFNTMIFAPGCPLHCDPHGGNLAIRPNNTRRHPYNFDVILYDHGLYRDIDLRLRRNYARLWLAVIDADVPKMKKYAHEVAGITEEQFPLFASAITGRDYSVLTGGAPPSTSPTPPPSLTAGSEPDPTGPQNSQASTPGGVISTRTASEKSSLTHSFGSHQDLIQQLVSLLGKVPRIILLILKTNDLTRSLDEGLQTGEGPERTFLILAKYAGRCVWEEERENILQGHDAEDESSEPTVPYSSAFTSSPTTTSTSRSGIAAKRLKLRSLPRRYSSLLQSWLRWKRIELKLWFFERWVNFTRRLGFVASGAGFRAFVGE